MTAMGDAAPAISIDDLLQARTDVEANAAVLRIIKLRWPTMRAIDESHDGKRAYQLFCGPSPGWRGIGPILMPAEHRICVTEEAADRWWIRVYDRKQPRSCLVDLIARREDTGRIAAAVEAKGKTHG